MLTSSSSINLLRYPWVSVPTLDLLQTKPKNSTPAPSIFSSLELFSMGNSESVLVSRHEIKHRSGGRGHVRVSAPEQDRHHQKKRRHTSSSGSDTSNRRTKHKVRFEKPESPLATNNLHSGGRRYSRDYSYGGYTGMEYIVDQGYVIPGIKASQDLNRPPPPRPTTERRQDIYNRAGSHIPRRVVPIIYEESESTNRPEQYSRVLPVPRRRMGRHFL